ncbi:MAG: vWA domain-containing protein [Nannocystaceae bacterium]
MAACSGDDSSSAGDASATSTVTVTASTGVTMTAGTATMTGTATDTNSGTMGSSSESGTESDSDTTTMGGSNSNSDSNSGTETTTASTSDTDGTTMNVTDSDTEGGCGNAMLDPGEICDDGVNDGAYDGCMPGCMELGPHCGDGVVEEGAELCDDGNNIDDDACSNACGADKCKEIMVVLEPLTPNVQMVLDKSGSMVINKWDADEDPNTPDVTRWYSLHGVVSSILTGFQDKLNLGVTLFPSKAAKQTYDANACVVSANPEVGCAANNKNMILSAIPAAGSTAIYGGTPSSAGMHTALMHLKSLDPLYPRLILFITDGAANCPESWKMGDPISNLFEVYDDALHQIVSDAFTMDNIPTYVIGIDISKTNTGNTQDGNPNNIVPYDKLNDLATKGGKPQPGVDKFYNTKSQVELQAALDQIANEALSCVIPFDEAPVFPQNTKVKSGDDLIPQVKDCMSEDGWVYADPENKSIELCGSWCQTLKMTGMVDVEFYCKPG